MLDDSMINGAVARARRRGKRLGWPKKIVRAAKIAHLRSQRHSWREITEETGISKGTAQLTVSSLPQNICLRAPNPLSSTLFPSTAAVASWRDTVIVAYVPSGASTGPFTVTVNGNAANSVSFTVSTLPSGWTDGDIGSVGVAGSASFANGTFTASGAGGERWSPRLTV